MVDVAVRVLDQLDPLSPLGTQWERLLRANSSSGIMQSLHWAQVKRRQGLCSFHLGVFEDDTLIGGAIFYRSQMRTGVGILVAPEGPVLPWENDDRSARALALITETVERHAADLGVMSMRIEPRLSAPEARVLGDFRAAPADLVPRDTLYLDLTQSDEALLASMKPKARYNINLSGRHGVKVVEDTSPEAVNRFYSAMLEASDRSRFAVEPLPFFEHLVGVMGPAGYAKLLFAEHEGTTLGTLLLTTYGTRGTYLYGGTTDQKRNLMGGYALQWSAMQTARQAGCTTYDFYGIAPLGEHAHPYARFTQFKQQFGGTVVGLIGAQDYYFLDNVADAFIRLVNQTRIYSNH